MIFFKFVKRFFIISLLFLSFIGVYISTAFLLTYFPSKDLSTEKKEEIIYILYDNVHSDIVFNINDISNEWIRNLDIIKNKKEGYVAFGWGDKETYLNTPTWNEIKISTSFKALFINTPSLMHITYYPHIKYFTGVKSIKLSKNQSKKIKKSIFKSFDLKKEFYKGYGRNDIFYSSLHKYNILHTCNTWTGDTLRDANILMSYWTPFSKNVISSLP